MKPPKPRMGWAYINKGRIVACDVGAKGHEGGIDTAAMVVPFSVYQAECEVIEKARKRMDEIVTLVRPFTKLEAELWESLEHLDAVKEGR